MANPIIGHVQCPMCGNPNATVHEQQKGKARQKKYYRCYTPDGNGCGTIQSTGPDGQAYIEQNWRPLNMPKPDNLAETVEPTPEADNNPPADTPQDPPKKSRGLMGLFIADDDEEDAA